jgi:hypothetical protein
MCSKGVSEGTERCFDQPEIDVEKRGNERKSRVGYLSINMIFSGFLDKRPSHTCDEFILDLN